MGLLPARIVTDSSCDLPAALIEALKITVVPLIVRFGSEVYQDGELSRDEFWDRALSAPPYPQTSQPSIGAFEDVFASLTADGSSVVCLTVTSKHSGTYNSAWAASQRFVGLVHVIDTASLSLGHGLQVLAAARAAAAGRIAEEITALVADLQRRMRMFILLDTIEYLRRGGRADGIMPILDRVARALRVKPLLTLVDGKLSPFTLARSHSHGLARIRQEIERLMPVEQLAVVHSRFAEAANDMAQKLAQLTGLPLSDVLVAETGPALASHAGPRVIGVAAVHSEKNAAV
ncbi:MAG TPA: DegV family protein [Anaerolineae bacterium]|nr:DegV family protein [Anaerolineae bacterium]